MVEKYLVDTMVVSEMRKPRPDSRVTGFLTAQDPSTLFLSTVSLAELRFGIELLHVAQQRIDLEVWLEQTVRRSFRGRILDVTEDVILRWRQMIEQGRKSGLTPSQPDLMIAATAAEHGLTVLTRNVKDFANLQVQFFNPWE